MKSTDPVADDAAELLYRHGIGSVAVSFVASTFLFVIAALQTSLRASSVWWGLMTTVLFFRLCDIILWHKRHRGTVSDGGWHIRRFTIGVVSAAALWAAFPLSFFSHLNLSGRATTAIILSGMAGGSATVLAPVEKLSLTFSSFLICPISIQFLFSDSIDNKLLGALGCVFFLVMASSSRLSHRASMHAIRLNRANQSLIAAMAEERKQTEAVNQKLKAAQTALHETNQSLEFRIRLRTAEIQQEIAEKEQYASELAHLASTDQLTGICNRAKLYEHVKDRLSEARANGEILAILFIDLDRFKEVNDLLGHYAGDRVLKITATRMAGDLPPNGLLARWGGDEFVAVLPDIQNQRFAIQIGTALRSAISAPIDVFFKVITIDATIGIALFPEHGWNDDELIRAADIAMYAGKQEKRSHVRLFEPVLNTRLTERYMVEQALHDAVLAREFRLVFEPIVSASDRTCRAMEALTRWTHPKLGVISPTEFIPLAERTGDINAIGEWVLFEACREAATWPGENPPAVSVNVSVAQILSGSLVTDVSAALMESRLPAHRLWLEVTETLFVGDRNVARSTLEPLRNLGVHISLDDFGTGFSSFAYLRNFPVDSIKIERSFVQGIEDRSDPIVGAIVGIARALGVTTIAEGIETDQQADLLISMGTEYLQGHLFAGGALTPSSVRQWLHSKLPSGGAERYANA